MKTIASSHPLHGRYIGVHGRRVHFLEHGDKAAPSVVLLHGCGSLAQEVLAPLRETDMHIVAPDRPGYGFSECLAGSRGPLAQSYWLEQLIDALRLHDVVLVGHSIGCAPLLILAERRPDLVSGLCLIAPFCRPTPEETMLLLRLAVAPAVGPLFTRHIVQRFAGYFGQRAMRAAHHPNPIPQHLLEFPYRHAANYQAICTMADELLGFNGDMERASELEIVCPVKILYGDADGAVDPHWHLEWLARRVPQADITWLEGVGHNPHHAAPGIICGMVRAMAYASDKRSR